MNIKASAFGLVMGLALFVLIPAGNELSAQSLLDRFANPQVTVKLTHPPGLGLKVNKVAFWTSSAGCAEQIVDGAINDFVRNNVEVIDRSNLSTILKEHSFTMSGSVDKTSAATLGKILGPSVLIFINVLQCSFTQDKVYDTETKYDSKTKRNYNVTAYFSRTRVFLRFSLRAVDLTTGRIFAAQSFDYSPQKSNKSYQGYPEFPTAFEVQESAFQSARWDIYRAFFPWSEERLLYFFDDKDYNLKEAYQALKSGDLQRAFEISKKNLEVCRNDTKAKDKILSHAVYNLGMCHMLRAEYNEALAYFNEANKLKSGSIFTEAIADCQKAAALAASMQKVEEKAAIETAKINESQEKKAQAEEANLLTNESVIDMVKLKLPESIVLQKIKNSKCSFDTSPTALSNLTKSGVSEKIVMAMIEKE